MSTLRKISVMGGGSWGTTLAKLLCENGHDVIMWEFDSAQALRVQNERVNERFLPGVHLDDSLRVTSELAEAVAERDILVIVVPSHTVRAVARQIVAVPGFSDSTLIVNAAKGLEEGSLLRMSEVLTSELPQESDHVLSLMGPSHAEEVSRQVPTSVVVAGTSDTHCQDVQDAFARPYFRVYTNSDLIGVELGVALKNSIAIAAGIVDGLGYGDNTKAALITRGLAEITRLGVAMGATKDTFSGLAGVGDLVVTCLSQHSRNRHVGEAIGKGQTLEQVLSEMVMVAEGVRTTRAAVELGARHKVELPIIEMVHAVLFENKNPREAIDQLMTRPLREEMPG